MDIADKLAISELLSRSAYGLDAKDLDLLQGCFTEDANFTLTIEGVPEASKFTGLKEIMGLFTGALEVQTDERKHVLSNLWYTDEGDQKAVVLSYLSLFATENGETNLITTGLYKDTVRKGDDGIWQVVDRNLTLDRPY
ncbi:MAG: nuclear transport factor 2 family protein [Pseudomonadota bacterium]